MESLVLCTGNPAKADELRALLPVFPRIITLAEAGLPEELPETGDTLEANALQKARFAFDHCGLPCVADDSGLEVAALGGAPGVRSARYAGEAKDPAANMAKLLTAMRGMVDRSARFRTVIAMVDANGERTFQGTVEGVITEGRRGTGGFGYDPVFLPTGSELTFAQMGAAAKNAISHRGKAVLGLVEHLSQLYGVR